VKICGTFTQNYIHDVLVNALNELKLDINFKKSKIIRLGPGSHMKSLWRMENQNQEETRIIEEADHYKYLGVTFGKGKPYVKHMNEVKHQIPFKVACLKAKSSQATDKQIAAVALWNNVVLPTLTYGAEVITFNPDTINRIDSAQNGIGKWILGTSKTSNPQAVKGLLNMGSIEMLLSTKLLSMWSSILAMGSERWPKMIMDHMRSSNKKFTWYSSVLKALGKYHLSMDFYPSIKAKKQITSLCSVFYWNQWQSSHKPYFNLLLKPDLHESTDKQLAIYYRITTNDKWSITGSYSNVCPLCSMEWKSWLFHITYLCHYMTNESETLTNKHGLAHYHIENEEFPANHDIRKNTKDIIRSVQKWYKQRVESMPRQ